MPVVVRSPALEFQVVVLVSLPAEVGIDPLCQLFDRAPLGDLDVHEGLRGQFVDQVELRECLSCFVLFPAESPRGIGDRHRSTVGHAPGREIPLGSVSVRSGIVVLDVCTTEENLGSACSGRRLTTRRSRKKREYRTRGRIEIIYSITESGLLRE